MGDRLALLPALGLALTSLAGIGAVTLQPGAPGTPVAVFFSPYDGDDMALRRVAAAGGEILRHGVMGTIVIARSDDSDFTDRLYAKGALLVSSAALAWACTPIAPRSS